MGVFRVHMNKRCKSKKEARYKDTQMNTRENFSVLYIAKRLGVEREKPGGGWLSTLSHHGAGGAKVRVHLCTSLRARAP